MKKIILNNFEVQKLVDLLSAQDSIINNRSENKIPIALLWNIDKNYEKLSKINNQIQSMRGKIEQEYISDEFSYDNCDENGNVIGRQIKPEYMGEFARKINELLSIDNEVDIATIPLSKIEELAVDGYTLQCIKFMIEDDTEEIVEGTVE